MYKKNDLVTVTITDIGSEGEGIGKIDGYALFVKDAMVGDTVEAKILKVKKNYAFARCEKIVTPSEYREEPVCKFHKSCGGCQIQAMDYKKQCDFKTQKVKNNLMRIGGFDEQFLSEIMEPIGAMDEPFHYRNKALFPIGTDKNGEIIAGFYAGRTHSIIANTDCALLAPETKRILEYVISFMKKYGVKPYDETSHKGLVRHVLIRSGFTSGEIMVCLVINDTSFPYGKAFAKGLCELSEIGVRIKSICISPNKKKNNVIMGDSYQVLWGDGYITDKIGEVSFQISPLSFFQVNPVQTKKLYEQALAYANLSGEETVWDLYCGIGTISLFLAQKAKQVYGVEVIEQAIEDAKQNAKINGFTNAEFMVGKAEEVLPKAYKEDAIYADVIVVDPPRKGCDERCLETMVQMQPMRIVYVSCDSATLARDLKYLCENGYELKKVRPFDQFPMTVHVETVCLLSRKP